MPVRRYKKPETKKFLWFVSHPDHCRAPVMAEDVEQATVEAAHLWGVPWASVAAHCDAQKRGEARKQLCARCGMFHYGEEDICVSCRKALEDEERRVQEACKAYYRRHAGEIRKIMREAKRSEH